MERNSKCSSASSAGRVKGAAGTSGSRKEGSKWVLTKARSSGLSAVTYAVSPHFSVCELHPQLISSADLPRPPFLLPFFTPYSHSDFQAPGKFTHFRASLVCYPFRAVFDARKMKGRLASRFSFLLTRLLGVVSSLPSSLKNVSSYLTLPPVTHATEVLDLPRNLPSWHSGFHQTAFEARC